MKFFLDTEFIDDGKTIEPISIGIITETGAEFYVELEFDEEKARRIPFLVEHVLPHLKATVGDFEASLERSKKDFSDFLEKQYATISWEADPSTSLGLIFNSMPIEDKVLLQYEIAQILTNPETGREYLAEWLGLIGSD
ncbi:hypothetical protein LCGC14_2628920, partial [marine sediment metagenome]